ncbi:hypothetical protein CGZ80_03470 [Rhodopirellula sp. MGV]|nr:hypothetical protein CGZ80_03470 [Rhodopirellula sp. MGV]
MSEFTAQTFESENSSGDCPTLTKSLNSDCRFGRTITWDNVRAVADRNRCVSGAPSEPLGILVAITTGPNESITRRSCNRLVGGLRNRCGIAFTVWLLSIAICAAENPRLRSPSARSDAGDSDSNERSGGLFGFRSILGSDKDDDAAEGDDLLRTLPLQRLTPQAKSRIVAVTDNPTIRRRLPSQAIRCDEDLFLFLTRQPEAIIGLWDLMGITNVQVERIGPYQLKADDGSGTTCVIDLVYGDRNLHIYYAEGKYDGKFAQKPIIGKGLFVFRSSYAVASDGGTTVMGTLDCYVKFESLGADLIARSLRGLIGKSADHNYVETASFISQAPGPAK